MEYPMEYLKWNSPKNHFSGQIKCFINIGEAFRVTLLITYLFRAFQQHLGLFFQFSQLNNCNLSPDCRHGNARAIILSTDSRF